MCGIHLQQLVVGGFDMVFENEGCEGVCLIQYPGDGLSI